MAPECPLAAYPTVADPTVPLPASAELRHAVAFMADVDSRSKRLFDHARTLHKPTGGIELEPADASVDVGVRALERDHVKGCIEEATKTMGRSK